MYATQTRNDFGLVQEPNAEFVGAVHQVTEQVVGNERYLGPLVSAFSDFQKGAQSVSSGEPINTFEDLHGAAMNDESAYDLSTCFREKIASATREVVKALEQLPYAPDSSGGEGRETNQEQGKYLFDVLLFFTFLLGSRRKS